MTQASPTSSSARIRCELAGRGAAITLGGRLDAENTGKVWREGMEFLDRHRPAQLLVDASEVEYCDGSGIGFLLKLRDRQQDSGGSFELRGLAEEFQRLLDVFDPEEIQGSADGMVPPTSFPAEVGEGTVRVWQDMRALVSFVGELGYALGRALAHPRRVRWSEVFRVAEAAGVNALPIVALISFLTGLIMAFQAAIPLRQFGAQIFIANLIALSMLRELGPLMTAIILAGRSGSAFAAELGTMKVREEIDALQTMGLDPVRFLVVNRVVAAVLMTPLLTVFADLLGLLGGSVVLLSLGFSWITFFNQALTAVTYGDFLGGLLKSVFFGILVAGIGCLRGLQTKIGASAVGESTTRAVVSGIVLIVVTDGIFSVVYFYLGI